MDGLFGEGSGGDGGSFKHTYECTGYGNCGRDRQVLTHDVEGVVGYNGQL